MQFLKNNFGIKTFVLCWILVLLVPNWREKIWQQSESDQLGNRAIVQAQAGFEKIPARDSKDWKARLESLERRIDKTPAPLTEDEPTPTTNLLERKRQRLAEIEQKRATRSNDQRLEQYRALSKEFPRENDIRKAWLLSTSRERNRISNDSIEAAIQCTIEGAKIEPQNSFFPVMQAAFLFALQRNEQALSVMHRAANCEYFDDGSLATVLRRIELLSRTQSVSWVEKEMIFGSVLLPHFWTVSQMRLKALGIADQKRKQGQKMAALEIAYDLQRIGETFGQRKQNMISMFVGRLQIVDAWKKAVGNTARTDSGRGEHRLKAAQAFAAYARSLGREDIANSALKADLNLRKYDSYVEWRYEHPQQIQKDFNFLSVSYWLQTQCVRLAFLGAIAWILSLIFTRKLEFQTLSTRRNLFSWASFCLGSTIILFALGIYFFTAGMGNFYFLFSTDNQLTNRRMMFGEYLPYILAFIWLMPTIVLTGIQYATYFLKQRKSRIKIRWKTVLLNTLYSIIFVLFNVLFFSNSGNETKVNFWLNYQPVQLLTFLFAVLIGTIFHLRNSKGANRIAAVLFWGAMWVGILFFYYSSFNNEDITLNCGFISIVLFVLSGLMYGRILAANGFFRSGKTRFHCPNYFPDFAYRIRVVAAVLCVCTSVSYIAFNVIVLPTTSRVEATIDRQLEIGELAWLDEQKQTEKAS